MWVQIHIFLDMWHLNHANSFSGVQITFTSSEVLVWVKTQAELLFLWSCRCVQMCQMKQTRTAADLGSREAPWNAQLLLKACFWRLDRWLCVTLWDLMNEWAHYQYEIHLKYLARTHFYLLLGKVNSNFLRVRSDSGRANWFGLASERFLGKLLPKMGTETHIQ